MYFHIYSGLGDRRANRNHGEGEVKSHHEKLISLLKKALSDFKGEGDGGGKDHAECTFKGDGKGNFQRIPFKESGFFAHKDVRDMVSISADKSSWIFVLNNNDHHDLFKVSASEI